MVLANYAGRALAAAGKPRAVDDVLRDWDRLSRQVIRTAWSERVEVGPDGWISVTLEGQGHQWGVLVLCGYREVAALGRMLAERAAEALAVYRLLGAKHRVVPGEEYAGDYREADWAGTGRRRWRRRS